MSYYLNKQQNIHQDNSGHHEKQVSFLKISFFFLYNTFISLLRLLIIRIINMLCKTQESFLIVHRTVNKLKFVFDITCIVLYKTQTNFR